MGMFCKQKEYRITLHLELHYISTKIDKNAFLQILATTPTQHVQQYYQILIDEYNLINRQKLIQKLQETQYDKKADLTAIFNEYAPKTAIMYMTKTKRREYMKQNNVKFEKYELGVRHQFLRYYLTWWYRAT